MALTPIGQGYWIARRDGQVYSFGNALTFRSYTASPCDPVVAIISNPARQGYRLVTRSGATIARGFGLAGQGTTGTPVNC